MTVLDDSVTVRLSTAMRDGSAAEHEAAEGSAFLAELLDGRLRAAGYIAYLRRLRLVYAALEEVVRAAATDPLAATVADPDLDRLSAIEADLAFWTGEQVVLGSGGAIDSVAAHAHGERLRLAAATWGGALVAHHCTRYLGDLSGGRVIGALLAELGGRPGEYRRRADRLVTLAPPPAQPSLNGSRTPPVSST